MKRVCSCVCVFSVMSGSFRLKQLDRAVVYETGSRAWTETGPANSKTHTHTHTHFTVCLSVNKFQHLSLACQHTEPRNSSHSTCLSLSYLLKDNSGLSKLGSVIILYSPK